MSSGRTSVLKRTTTSASKSKATAAPAAVMAAATRRLPRGSGSALAPTRTGLSNDAAATFIGCGSSSAPAPNPSGHINGMAAADLIHLQSLADDINCSSVHGRRGYPVAAGYSHGAVVMDSSL
ncbi:hypothetical protein BDA96_04G248200 [Sorghum bicolor]|uniref:Uncharacterized protein n=2 Tax=Sorghum bicolor TaxID=4558 RepID=A0A921R6E7_SORBI|nr:hypothetical protein BDA96_04G248200 [Sorghum bicolor]KXG30732.1 hypothetical protein SORBI_3004G233000 [Sorghum bicolor]